MSPLPQLLPWGRLPDGRTAHLVTLTSATGLSARISDYGGLIVGLEVPDRHGRMADVVLGFDDLASYLTPGKSPYFGCLVGRVGNRIAHGRCTVAGRRLQLVTNNSPGGIPCHLHGGTVGFDKVLWSAEVGSDADGQSLTLRHRSPDGDEGYPGTLDVTVTYRLAGGELAVTYEAVTDATTLVNLTQHSYFNLAGAGSVLDHHLTVHAGRMVPVDAGLIPLGHLEPVAGGPFDFRTPRTVGERIDADHPQVRAGGGYDHTWVIDGTPGHLRPAARLADPVSGRVMEVLTTEPGVQVYSGNFMPPTTGPGLPGKTGKVYHQRGGICLETQHFPDAPNQPTFPSIVLQPGDTYRSQTIFRFMAA